MRVAIMADLHVHSWNEHSTPTPDGPSRLVDCWSVITECIDWCVDNDVKNLVIAGDLFHKRGVLMTQAYNEVVRELVRAQPFMKVYALPGNHDQADRAGTVDAVQALESAELVTGVPRKGRTLWNLMDGKDELIVAAFTYCDSHDLLKQRIEKSEAVLRKQYKDEPAISVFHHGFRGAMVGSALEYQVKEEIDPAWLDWLPASYHFSGHYHHHQAIGGRKDACYIGSPLEHVRGDGGQKKGFRVYDSKTNTHELVPLKRPRFVVLDQEKIDNDELDRVEGNFVDVVYETLPMEPDKYRDYLFKHGARGVKPCPMPKKRTASKSRMAGVTLATSQNDLLDEYVKFRGVTDPDDRDELTKLGRELLEKVR